MDPASSLCLSPDELLIIWGHLAQCPTDANKPVRDKIKNFLEGRLNVATL